MAPNQSNQQQTNQNDLTALASRIDLLIETINKRFDDVRLEMRDAMDRYVLNAVHELEVKRLDEKDKQQQDALDELRDLVFTKNEKNLTRIASFIAIAGTLLSIAHVYLHLF